MTKPIKHFKPRWAVEGLVMPYEFYRVLHLLGIFTVVVSLGGMCLHVIGGGTKASPPRKLAMMTHGIGLLIVLISGFGLLAKLGAMHPLPMWAAAKLVVYLILGALPALIYRKPQMAKLFWLLTIAFASLNAYFAIYKPF